MATIRKASAYSKRSVTPYTRTSRKRKKSFIKMVPAQKIVKFTMGNDKLFKEGKLNHVLTIVTTEKIQIRHNAFEACRQYINKKLYKELNEEYMFKVIPFPHHIQRENKMITGAGADRMQTGMQLAYGKAAGKAAILKKGGRIFVIATADARASMHARNVIKQVKSKLPCKIQILSKDISKDKKLLVKKKVKSKPKSE
jgi:large subunit ribosomal protein L10e